MTKKKHSYKDAAIVLAWPDTTARGDHAWCTALKKLGILKNQNFKVGHAAIMLVNRSDGSVHYYDFGRYLTPRGYGRARSKQTDPLLSISTKAVFNDSATGCPITNLDQILNELESLKACTHGNGPLYASVCLDFDFEKGNRCALDFVHRGSMIYSAFMPGNSNCSRFVESVLIAGLNGKSTHRKRLIVHETIVSSPISNVVNASWDGNVQIVDQGVIEVKSMNRASSRAYFISQTLANFKKDAAAELPGDQHPGYTNEPVRSAKVPTSAQWLGGIGEGAWFDIKVESNTVKLVKYDHHGNEEYQRLVESSEIDWMQPMKIDYDTHASKLTVIQYQKRVSIPLMSDVKEIQKEKLSPNPKIVTEKHELQYSEI